MNTVQNGWSEQIGNKTKRELSRFYANLDDLRDWDLVGVRGRLSAKSEASGETKTAGGTAEAAINGNIPSSGANGHEEKDKVCKRLELSSMGLDWQETYAERNFDHWIPRVQTNYKWAI